MDKIIEFIVGFYYLCQEFPYSQEIEDIKRQAFNLTVKASFGDKDGFLVLGEYIKSVLNKMLKDNKFDDYKIRLLRWKLDEFILEFGEFFDFSQLNQNKEINKEAISIFNNREINEEIGKEINKISNLERIKLIADFFLGKRDAIKFKEVADLFPNTTGRTIRNDLAKLVKDGFLIQEGRGKGSFYRLADGQTPVEQKGSTGQAETE